VGIPTELLKCLLPQGCPGPSSPSSIPEIIDRSQLGALFPNPLEKLFNPNPSDTDGYDDDLDRSPQDGPYDEAN
jgi:hypothetical protein